MKKKLLQYGICSVVGALLSLWVMSTQGMFIIHGEPKVTLMILCDSFFVAGALLALMGALVWVSTTGFFDALSYALKTAAHMFLPFMKIQRQSFYDYKMEKEEKRGKTPYFVLIVGLAYLLLAVIFLIIWSV